MLQIVITSFLGFFNGLSLCGFPELFHLKPWSPISSGQHGDEATHGGDAAYTASATGCS